MITLVQMLCPKRHCILMVAYEDDAGTFLQACEELEQIIRESSMNRWCAICGSRDLRFEEGKTWETMEGALPHIRATEQAQIFSRRLLDAMGETVEGPGSFDVEKIMQATRRHWR